MPAGFDCDSSGNLARFPNEESPLIMYFDDVNTGFCCQVQNHCQGAETGTNLNEEAPQSTTFYQALLDDSGEHEEINIPN